MWLVAIVLDNAVLTQHTTNKSKITRQQPRFLKFNYDLPFLMLNCGAIDVSQIFRMRKIRFQIIRIQMNVKDMNEDKSSLEQHSRQILFKKNQLSDLKIPHKCNSKKNDVMTIVY